MRTERLRVLTTPLLAGLLLTACGGGDAPGRLAAESADSPSTASPTAGPSASPTGTATPSVAPATPTGTDDDEQAGDGADTPFRADRSVDEREATGIGLSVVDVRTGRHEGYDRVVLELAGEGTVGWRVGYDDAPSRQGSGEPVELAGDQTLALLVTGVGYPFDNGVPEYHGPRSLTPAGLDVVEEVLVGGVYEGQYEAFVGVGESRPFRVTRLADPERLVVDVAHNG